MTATPHHSTPTYADVVVPRQLHRPFTYLVPQSIRGQVHVGARVLVPFGTRTLHGTVVALTPRLPEGDATLTAHRVRAILSVVTDADTPSSLNREELSLAQAVADRYLAPVGPCIRLVTPSSSDQPPEPRYRLASAITGFPRRLPPTARAILERLADSKRALSQTTLKRTIKGPLAQTLTMLERRGLVRVEVAAIPQGMRGRQRRAGQASVTVPPSLREATTAGRSWANRPERPAWWSRFLYNLSQGHPSTFLLTSSWDARMACLQAAVTEALANGRSALVLVPESLRAAVIAAAGRACWNTNVELWHSGLSILQRRELRRRLSAGAPVVVVGTRSAVFSPLPRLGLIWVDEEEDASFKEEQVPRYHARDVAWLRARHHGANLILASAHPSLETCQQFLAMPEQTASVGSANSPQVAALPASARHIQLVDMRQAPYGLLLSEALLTGISTALDQHAGAIVLLNRKGFASVLFCRDCGTSPRCARCSVALAFYRRAGRLLCSQCGGNYPLPETCPHCLAPRLEPIGFGTERLQEELQRVFRGARIARLDAETARTASQRDSLRQRLAEGHLDLLVATQMVLEGPPAPPVGFVGFPHADAGLHVPDFRAAERLYHTLLDALELVRPAEAGGRAVLQTYLPSHHAIQAVITASPELFREAELQFRHALGYPPFSHLIALRITGTDPRRTETAAQRCAALLAASRAPGTDVAVLGPAPAHVAQRRGRHRWQLLVKATEAEHARHCVRACLSQMERSHRGGGVRVEVDVDPVEML